MGASEKIGWAFFVAGSLVFTGVGVAGRDWWTVVGGVLYTVGCGALLHGAVRGDGR